jgi:glycosyltransferase involved in cell wall biosynthesis
MIKVLGLALYGPMAASTRYRLGQYVPGLASLGIDLQIYHLLGDDYLRSRFNGLPLNLPSLVKAALARLADLWRHHEYDMVILHCELFPLAPGWMERALIRKPYIYDYDDAFYLKYRRGRLGIARTLLGRKFDNVMEGAAAVTAGNYILTQYAKHYNFNTHYLPTVLDTGRYVPRPALRAREVFTVGWIGSPSTAPYLSELVLPLSAIGQECAVRFVVIGGKAPVIPNVEVIEVGWNENTEVDLINSFDVGVMPLPDEDWTQGKCAFKLIQYMACAVPVIASPVGANFDVVNAKCGLMASTPQEWIDAIRMLRDQPERRVAMGYAARERAVLNYSLHQNLPVLGAVITNIAKSIN